MKTRDARSLSAQAQEDLRRKAVKAVGAGKPHVAVVSLFGVTRHAVDNWIKTHRQGGARALKPWQAAQIAKTITDRRPDQLKLPFYWWTREAVAQLIAQRFGVRLSVWTVGRYLARRGFTPQQPGRRAFEQNPEAVRHWREPRLSPDPCVRQA